MRDAAALWDMAIGDIEDDIRSRYVGLGGTLFEAPGLIGLLNSPVPFPCYFHGADADVRAALPRLLASNPIPRVHIVDGHPQRQALEEGGWVLDQSVTQMVLPLSHGVLPVVALPGVALEGLEIPQGIAAFYAAMSAGFGSDLVNAEAELPREVIITQGIRLFVARDEKGEIIGTAGARRRSRGANLFAISVVPAWRGRGLGSALTALASAAMFDVGAASVQLHATEAGNHVYERAGFGVAGRWHFYRPTVIAKAAR